MSDDKYISVHKDLEGFRERMARQVHLTSMLGKGSPEYYEAMLEEGFLTEEEVRKARERDEARRSPGVKTNVHSHADGSMSATITADSKALTEDAINESIRSLGDRRGDSPPAIAAALQSRLNAKGTGLDDETLAQISELLADGEEVVIGIGRKER